MCVVYYLTHHWYIPRISTPHVAHVKGKQKCVVVVVVISKYLWRYPSFKLINKWKKICRGFGLLYKILGNYNRILTGLIKIFNIITVTYYTIYLHRYMVYDKNKSVCNMMGCPRSCIFVPGVLNLYRRTFYAF